MERVILTTGGTGGHIFPALAVAEEIRARFPKSRVLFVGGSYGPEADLARKAGLEFVGLPVRGVLGRGWRAVGAVFFLCAGLLRSLVLIGKFRPEAVLGFGGYAAFGPVAAAALRGVPTAVHEQNSVPGAANRLLGRLARKVLLSFPDERGMFDPAKTVLTGNPVRQSICRMHDEESEGPRAGRLLVVGGSQGAKALNAAMLKALPRLAEAGVDILHQTGLSDLERVKAGYAEAGYAGARAEAFIEDMADAYCWADLVLCRAGATTVAELAVAGRPAVFVPFPHATHDHQTANARFLERVGAALVVEESKLSETDLAGLVIGLLSDRDRLRAMGAAAALAGRAEAAAHVVSELESMARA